MKYPIYVFPNASCTCAYGAYCDDIDFDWSRPIEIIYTEDKNLQEKYKKGILDTEIPKELENLETGNNIYWPIKNTL